MERTSLSVSLGHPIRVVFLNVTIVKGNQVSDPVINEPIMADQEGLRYVKCLGACRHPGGQARGCHVECAKQMTPWPIPPTIQKLAYSYEPTLLEYDDRTKRLYKACLDFLSNILSRLPPELLSNITKMCLRSFAVENARSLHGVPSGTTKIRLSSEIWAHFTTFEGVSYLSSLSNDIDDYHDRRIFVPNPTSTITAVYLGEDYLGVREMLFRSSCSTGGEYVGLEHKGLWWRVVNLDSPTLVIETDVGSPTRLSYHS